LMQQLQLHVDGLGKLTTRGFLQTAMSMYQPSIELAFDYFPMFLHAVSSVVIGARFNNEFVLENVIGKEADQFYNEFVSSFMR